MNCANCGGAFMPVGNRPYFRCPYCETFHFPQELEDGIAVLGGDPPRVDCPICDVQLTLAAIEGHTVAYCQRCRGILVENATFSTLVQMKRSRYGTQEMNPVPFDRQELTRAINCPTCHKSMDAHPYHAGGNAVIDTCFRCRLIWLDAGELTVLGRYPNRSAPPIASSQVEPNTSAEEPEMTFRIFGFPIRLGV